MSSLTVSKRTPCASDSLGLLEFVQRPEFRNTRKHNVSKVGSVFVFRWRGRLLLLRWVQFPKRSVSLHFELRTMNKVQKHSNSERYTSSSELFRIPWCPLDYLHLNTHLEIEFNFRRSVGQSVLVSCSHLELITRFFFSIDNCCFLTVWRPLWREDVIYSYNRCWALSEKSLSGPSPAELLTIFCATISHIRIQFVPHRKFISSPLQIQPGHWGPIITHYCLIWDCVPFSSPLATRKAEVEVF
jgi:hypothetical protein